MRVERAKLISFDAATWTATIQPAEALGTYLLSVPVLSSVPEALMVANESVAVAVFDELIANDRVILGPWGTAPGAWVTSGMIVDGTIVNADVDSSAAIAASKIASGTFGGSSTARFPGNLQSAAGKVSIEYYDIDVADLSWTDIATINSLETFLYLPHRDTDDAVFLISYGGTCTKVGGSAVWVVGAPAGGQLGVRVSGGKLQAEGNLGVGVSCKHLIIRVAY